MGNILVVGEHSDGALRKFSLPTVAFAHKLAELAGGDVIGLILGSGAGAVAEEFAQYGFSKVIYVDGASYGGFLAESYAPAVAEVAKAVGATTVAGPASTQGKDYLPRLAQILEAGMVNDVIAVASEGGEIRYKRPMWAGNVIATVAVDTPVTVVSVRATAYDPPAAGAAAPVENQSSAYGSANTTFVSFEAVASARPDLSDADVIVAGGRGLKAAENFGMLEELADLFGGAVGASRAAVDSGMAPYDYQIGQTGKIVAPDLYFAVAISGAIQHLAGMKGSKTIVAINKDAEAPIFQVADYGLVADAFKAVPELNAKVKAAKG
jgi:electron transfer flavoprotein alpha subunit